MNKKLFTAKEVEILKGNPFTLTVTERQIRFTVEFKRFLLNERETNGTPWKEIFRKAGYDPEILGSTRIQRITENVRKEAASPKGLHETTSKTRYLKENERIQMQKSIQQLQKQVLWQQQQIEFLKKTQMLNILDTDEK